jgi:hypothetical protein
MIRLLCVSRMPQTFSTASVIKSRTRARRPMTAVPSTAEDPARPGRGTEAATVPIIAGSGWMRLSVFRCPGPTPVVTALSRECGAKIGALVVIDPFCDEFFFDPGYGLRETARPRASAILGHGPPRILHDDDLIVEQGEYCLQVQVQVSLRHFGWRRYHPLIERLVPLPARSEIWLVRGRDCALLSRRGFTEVFGADEVRP